MRQEAWDVIVVGGGVSGVVAATAAARNGARTLLIEKDGSLGGTMTMCLVGPMMTFHSATEQVIRGLAQEVVDRLVALKASPGHILDTTGYVATVTPFDAEALRLVAQRMVKEAGAEVLFHSTVVDVTKSDQELTGIVVQHRNGRALLQTEVVVDATGDADVAALAGAPCAFGRPKDGLVQPVSLMFKVGGWDKGSFTDYVTDHPEVLRLSREGIAAYQREPLVAVAGFEELLREAIVSGELGDLQREHVLFFNTHRPDEVIVNMSRVTGVDPRDAVSMSQAEVRGREQVFAIMDFLRRRVPGFSRARITGVGARVGVRESRRIVGEVVLTAEDVVGGRTWPDAIARSAYPIDIHSPTGAKEGSEAEFKNDFLSEGITYDIPYRSLIPLEVDGLLATGRCISTTVEAHGATRVSPSCMAFGQAAGTAAALAVAAGVPPREVDVGELQATLVRQGADLGEHGACG
ncbi:MAG: FAD-dependent oxidoreductase [Anaerolineae bacterium]